MINAPEGKQEAGNRREDPPYSPPQRGTSGLPAGEGGVGVGFFCFLLPVSCFLSPLLHAIAGFFASAMVAGALSLHVRAGAVHRVLLRVRLELRQAVVRAEVVLRALVGVLDRLRLV